MSPKAEAEMLKLLQAIAAGVGSILSELRGRREAGQDRSPERQVVLIPVCPTCGQPLGSGKIRHTSG
ncbi:MAG: hypothetical protein JXA73_00215 [Acidobacteria bacterium]|nr:hypothetical protein [Acidobacteriota bacterium]